MKTYIVGVFYQTPSGRAGAKNVSVHAKNEDEAMTKGTKKVKQRLGSGYRIQGGDAILYNRKKKRK